MGGDSQPDVKTTQQFGQSAGTTSGSSSGVTTQQLSPEQQSLLSSAMPYLQRFAASPPTMQGAAGTVAPFNPTQLSAQQKGLAAAGAAQDVVSSAGDASKFLTSGAALDPSTNPGLAGAITAANRPVFDNLTETILPAIRGGAAGSGGTMGANYGGSRQGIAEGIAAKGAEQTAGDNTSRIVNSGYNAGLDAMKTALGLAPSTASGMAVPAGITGAVGDVQQGQTQAEMNANNAAFNYQQWLPYLMGSTLGGLAGGLPGGSVASTGSTMGTGTSSTSGSGTSTGTAPQTNPFQLAMGGGLTAAGLMGGASKLLPFLI